jgi:hypothetical protein
VAGREYWFETGSHWIGGYDTDAYDGVLSFIGGICNTYREVASSRGYPLLGNYIVPGETMGFAMVPSGSAPVIHAKCDKCGVESVLAAQCPKCDGQLKSERAKYNFSDGKLVSISEIST